MRLAAYIKERTDGRAEFARAIGRNYKTVYRYTLPFDHADFQRPDASTMVAIYEATGGAVTPNDFYDLPDLRTATDQLPCVDGCCACSEAVE